MEQSKNLKLDELFAKLSNWDDKKCIETVIFSVGPLTALIAARCGVKTWLKYEILVSFVLGGILMIQPELILSHLINSPIDGYHKFLCSLYGCYLIYAVLVPLFVTNAGDFQGHYWSRIIANTLIIVDNLFSYTDSIHWNYKLLCSATSFYAVCLLINAYYLSKISKTKSGFGQDPVNCVAKLEAYMLLGAGLLMYSSPHKAMIGLTSINDVHRDLCRTCGILLFSLCFESFFLTDFVMINDKKQFMLSRLIGSLLELVVVLLGFYHFKVFGQTALCVYLTINSGYNLLVFYGYIITPKKFPTKKNN